ncbi:MAG: hypothetical protein DWQ17_03620 [Crenarchaeota archaeon]|nr:MAG: hypothetical protein DWQ17_03620 [Thermoproteota archaeon]
MTNTFATTQEIENQFAQMEQVLVQFIHNAFREEHNKHVPYAQIKKAYAKAMRKWARKDALKMKFGLVSDTITNE